MIEITEIALPFDLMNQPKPLKKSNDPVERRCT